MGDFDCCTPISPDCRDGNKHRACIGDAWDEHTDGPARCACDCHDETGKQ